MTIISKVISKEEYPDVLSITTSRPHAVEQLSRQTSQAVEHHVRLCGFSKDQVKQYIKQFCEYHSKPPETGEELIRVLCDERPDILEVAKIPIRTEMICIVWMVKAMVKAVRELQVKCHLHTLNMSNNNLDYSGPYLGKLVGLIPDLNRLGIDYGNMSPPSLLVLSKHLPESNQIQTLDICGNNLGGGTGGGMRLIKAMRHLEAISVGGSFFIPGPDPIPAVCGVVDAGSLNKRVILMFEHYLYMYPWQQQIESKSVVYTLIGLLLESFRCTKAKCVYRRLHHLSPTR